MCAAHDLGVEGDAEVGVEYDAKQGAATWLAVGAQEAAAVGEKRVVGENGADAREDCVGGVAKELHFVASGGPGEPVRLIGETRCRWWGELAVCGESGFEGDEGSAVLDEVGEGFVEVAGLLFEDAESDVDVGRTEAGDALAADTGVWVLRGDDAAGDSGFDERVGAGRGAAMVTAGFERDVGRCTLSGDSSGGCLLEGGDLGVIEVCVDVCAFGEDPVVADEDAANLRVW